MRWLHIVVIALFVVATCIFAIQNLEVVTLSFLGFRTPRTLTESRCPVLRRSDSGLWIPVGDEAA
jgi:hypothetical protein